MFELLLLGMLVVSFTVVLLLAVLLDSAVGAFLALVLGMILYKLY
nr:MAG TPA: hypothetical protein [Caudoviricetes sp.]